MFWSVKSHLSIATTWRISSSKKRRSNPVQRYHQRVQEEEVQWCFAMVTWRLDIKTGKKRRSKENISILLEYKLFQSIPVPSSNSSTFRRKCYWSCVARQRTVAERIYRVPLPRREREWIEFYKKKWINSRRNKPQKRKTSGLQHCRESDGGRFGHGGNSSRSDTRYWSDDAKNKLALAPYWSADKWIDVLAKGGGQKKRFQHCLKPNCPEKLLYLRIMQGHSRKLILEMLVSILHCKTMYCYQKILPCIHSSRRKRKGIEINSA